MRYDFSPTGYTITDELVNRASSQPQFLSHDLIKSSSIDVWTGPGNTGTRLIKNVDYSLTIKDIKRSEMAGFDIYTLFAIINPSFLSTNVYVSFVTCGDYVSIAGIQDIIDDMVDIPSIPTPGQKEALAGSRGTPGSGNKYLTQDSIGNEVCALEGGFIPAGVIPGHIDDLQEVYVVGSTPYAADWLSLTAGGSPLSPVGGRLYLVVSAGDYYHKSYRWAGTAYGITGSDLGLCESSSTAYRGDRGKAAYDHSQSTHAPGTADNTQGAISGAATKATPVDADTLALIDSESGSALKELLWSNVKATLKTYFDTLYTSAGGDTPENILAKLSTVDGYASGLVSEDSGKLGGVQLSLIALLNSPAFTGTPTAPTASPGTDSTVLATTEFVDDLVTNSVPFTNADATSAFQAYPTQQSVDGAGDNSLVKFVLLDAPPGVYKVVCDIENSSGAVGTTIELSCPDGWGDPSLASYQRTSTGWEYGKSLIINKRSNSGHLYFRAFRAAGTSRGQIKNITFYYSNNSSYSAVYFRKLSNAFRYYAGARTALSVSEA